ncbi:MAG: adenylosuccinate synthase [bacterium]
METVTAVVGGQWGDEGKGKIVDRFAQQADRVVRYQGGNNAGHTVVVNDKKYVLHLIPSGILHEDSVSVIGPGMVVNLRELMEEIEGLRDLGVNPLDRLEISRRAHVLFPFHQYLDARAESDRGDEKIGTTKKGIGPAYVDKVRRSGLRMADLQNAGEVREHCRGIINGLDDGWHEFDGITKPDALADEYIEYYDELKENFVDVPRSLRRASERGESILFEGAQGTMLDVDFGTYPFVTSSNPTSGGIVTGSGFPGHQIEDIVGVVKAYTTRVGAGDMPTELTGETGEWLREQGGEFGATTGRPRRCGWLDFVQLDYAITVNGLTSIALSKLDILSGLDEIKVAVEYELNGERFTEFPARTADLMELDPIYETLPGFEEDITDCRNWDELPPNARDYVQYVEDNLQVPIDYISVGPGREQLIIRN